jgi:hypothetical protein
MPRGKRLNYGNEPDAFGQDSPVWGLGHWLDEIGTAGSATEAEMGWCVGSGAPSIKGFRLGSPSQLRSRPWTGGDDTILTPFSLSPITDSATDFLPDLFLAYCTITDTT